MIDLNQEDFVNSAKITEDYILSRLSDESIFRYYISDLVIGRAFSSPLKKKDDHPSFGIFYANQHHMLMFKDQSLDISGDCIEFVKRYFHYTSRFEAISKIALDFGIQGDHVLSKNVTKSLIPPSKSVFLKSNYKKDRTVINITSRSWEYHDLIYWNKFGISKKTLIRFKVKPIKWVFINGLVYPVDNHAYAYEEIKDRELSYKIYQPYSKTNKWLNNATPCTHQGYTLLPKEGDLLIITKSLKDVMSLYDTTKIPAIGIQNENIIVKPSVMGEYTDRFTKVVCLFDNDNAGKRLSNKYKDEYNLPFILIPEKYKSKDFSDLVKNHGVKNAYKILKQLLNEIT